MDFKAFITFKRKLNTVNSICKSNKTSKYLLSLGDLGWKCAAQSAKKTAELQRRRL